MPACAFDELTAQECEKQIFKSREQLTYDAAKEARMALKKIQEHYCSTPTPTNECTFLREMYKIALNKEGAIRKELLNQHKDNRRLL